MASAEQAFTLMAWLCLSCHHQTQSEARWGSQDGASWALLTYIRPPLAQSCGLLGLPPSFCSYYLKFHYSLSI